MLFGYFDYLLVGVLLFLNIKFWKTKFDLKVGCLMGGILFGLVLPVISIAIELERLKLNGGWMDSFEVVYTYLRFPTYWLIGCSQSVVTMVKRRINTMNKQE